MIYDCFTFNDELDLLEIRLNELSTVVDRFVLAEADTTFSGKPKRLHYAENRDRFAGFADRITHVVVDDMPATGAWEREYHQRDCIARGLPNFPQGRDGDYILVSDVDEIVKAEALRAALPTAERVRFVQKAYSKFLNCDNGIEWTYPVLLPFRDLKDSINQIRQKQDGRRVPDGGWHFSYMGGSKAIKNKIASFSHQEYNNPQHNNRAMFELSMKCNTMLLAVLKSQDKLVTLDNLPRHVQQNPDKFRHMIAEREFPLRDYAEEFPEAARRHYMNAEECNWLFNMSQGLERAANMGSVMPGHTILKGMGGGVLMPDEEYFDRRLYFSVFGEEPAVAPLRGQAELWFIDGGHGYERTKHEIRLGLSFATKILVGFGYDHPEVKRAVDESISDFDLIGRLWIKMVDR